jgi:type VI secretion system protein ImpF
MPEPKPMRGAKALLFERLVDDNPHTPGEAQPFRSYGVGALRASVQRELMSLLNTRCPRPGGPLHGDGLDRTILDYGVPDLSPFGPANPTDMGRLAQILEQAIALYEPRLRQVRVEIQPAKNSQSSAVGSISANLVVGSVNEPVSFPLVLSLKTGEVVVGDLTGEIA